MLRIEPLGTGVILPAFVIGYEISDDVQRSLDDWDDAPNWLLTIDQQAGGHSMQYPSVVGCVLRFCDNSEFCRDNIDTVVRGFQAMAEDPNVALLRRDYPILSQLVCTWGDSFGKDQLQRLHQYLSRYFQIPSFSSGIEGFVRMSGVDSIQHFMNWNLLNPTVRTLPRQLYDGRKSIYFDDSNIECLDLSLEIQLGADEISVLREYGGRLNMVNPDIFLLWENSD